MAIVKVRGIRKDGRFTPLKRQKREAVEEFPGGRLDIRRKTSECLDHEYVDDHDDDTVKQSVLNITCQSPSDNHLSDRTSLRTKITGSQKMSVRSNIKRALKAYRDILLAMRTDERKAWSYIKIAKQLKEQGMWVNTKKHLGATPGVKIGDKIRYRAQLYVIGLHQQFMCGIDYMRFRGKNVATSIVDSGRYTNSMHNDILIYSGQGGEPIFDRTKPTDQTLKRGNLALMNSKEEGTPVRVIRSLQHSKDFVYVYYGLYIVEKVVQERHRGHLVYKFHLRRMARQPDVPFDRM